MIEEKAEKTKQEQVEKSRLKKEREKETGVKEEDEDQQLVPSFISGLQLEVQLLMRLNHPNVIRLYQVIETDEECYVIM
jgi:5'-AMP-activated protein kinase catalytic alpha subunit